MSSIARGTATATVVVLVSLATGCGAAGHQHRPAQTKAETAHMRAADNAWAPLYGAINHYALHHHGRVPPTLAVLKAAHLRLPAHDAIAVYHPERRRGHWFACTVHKTRGRIDAYQVDSGGRSSGGGPGGYLRPGKAAAFAAALKRAGCQPRS